MFRQISLTLMALASYALCAHVPEPVASQFVASGIVFDPIIRQMLRDNYDVWLARADTGEVDVLLTPSQLQQLQAQGLDLKVNAKLSWDARMQAKAAPNQSNGIANYPCYRTVEETLQRLDALALLHPNLVSVSNVGDSYLQSVGQGGYPIKAIRIENSAVPGAKAPMMLIGAIHAREYTTAETVLRFAEHLLGGYGTDADITWMLDHSSILLIPQANPDGRKRAETGISQRRNLRPLTCATAAASSGVDLNRNSSFYWGIAGGSSVNGCDDTFRGGAAGSEPEVQALESVITSFFADQRGPGVIDAAPSDTTGLFISLHSYSKLVLFPWGAVNNAAPNKAGLETLGRKFGHYTRYKVCQPPSCLYAASGTTDDKAYGETGVASFTFELGTSFFEACPSYEQNVWPVMRDALSFGLKAARRPYQEPSGPEVLQLRAVRTENSITIRGFADDTRSFSNGVGIEASQNIAGAEYFVDQSPQAGALPNAMQSADGAFDANRESLFARFTRADAASITRIFVRSRDSSGQFGVPAAVWVVDQSADLVFFDGLED
jgi:carboxypeptidase T